MIYSTAYCFSRVYGRLSFGRWRGYLRFRCYPLESR
jgi:hypothetical protein